MDQPSATPPAEAPPPQPRSLLKKLLLAAITLPLTPIVIANIWILIGSIGRTTTQVDRIPTNSTLLVLGTSPKKRNLEPNPFFEGRMDAAAALYHAGKTRRIILSGDRRRPEYDEPLAMRDALIKRSVPAEMLEPDNAGTRTLLSLQNARNTFHLQTLITVTDDFHQPRCLFLARHFGISAQGFSSTPVPLKLSFKTRLREIPSRLKAFTEVLLSHTAEPTAR
jgi:SanA protein